MNKGRTIFSQIMSFIPEREFKACVDRYKGKYRARNFTCKDQFLVKSYAQLTNRGSLRDIENCLTALSCRLFIVASAMLFLATLWPKPMRIETGESMSTLLRSWSRRFVHFMGSVANVRGYILNNNRENPLCRCWCPAEGVNSV